ncbi:hypothetical protein [Mycoplasma sp. P36-A1]|uniref:hypothetical protein n=1 Tax=Mycoplasma sp. P36-A1 TaxID=3252900 RepID=UPI003C2B6341
MKNNKYSLIYQRIVLVVAIMALFISLYIMFIAPNNYSQYGGIPLNFRIFYTQQDGLNFIQALSAEQKLAYSQLLTSTFVFIISVTYLMFTAFTVVREKLNMSQDYQKFALLSYLWGGIYLGENMVISQILDTFPDNNVNITFASMLTLAKHVMFILFIVSFAYMYYRSKNPGKIERKEAAITKKVEHKAELENLSKAERKYIIKQKNSNKDSKE